VAVLPYGRSMNIYTIIGLFGVAAYVSGYALLQLDRVKSDDHLYLLLNGLGSALILVSLLDAFNLPSFITQALWLVFTIVGFLRARRNRAR
jgi:hypothetical protein